MFNKMFVKSSIFKRFPKAGLLMFLVLLVGLFSIISQYFLTQENLTNILIQSAVPIIVSTGMTLVIATAGIDLSIGSVLAMSGIITAWGFKSGICFPGCIALGLLSGAVMGLINGVCVAKLDVSPFIVTLGTAGIYRAFALILTDSRPIYGMPLSFRMIGSGRLGIVPYSVMISVAVLAAGFMLLKWTRFGTHARAVGDNPEAAYRMSVPVSGTLITVYMLSGFTAALAGVIVTARLNTAEAIAGMGVELEAIAAVVMGGTSFFGGEGSMGGTLVGVLIIGVLRNGLTLFNIPSYYQQLVIGLVFILAVVSDRIRRRGKIISN
jgi:ribose/xylose/arabinose/galactoside ABC-type transport system permease subunit